MKKEDMGSAIRARFSDGTLKPLEALELKEGEDDHNCLVIPVLQSSRLVRADCRRVGRFG